MQSEHTHINTLTKHTYTNDNGFSPRVASIKDISYIFKYLTPWTLQTSAGPSRGGYIYLAEAKTLKEDKLKSCAMQGILLSDLFNSKPLFSSHNGETNDNST